MGDLGVVVVIEDDLDLRNLVEGVFLQSGFVVHTASDGRQGVEVVREKRPDVVSLDVGLPDIDGFEVLRRIRQFSNAYVVMLTGRTDEPDLLAALQGGADDYITKPFRPREMRARVAAMMRRPRNGSVEHDESPQPLPPVALAVTGGTVLAHNGLTLNPRTRITMLDGAPLQLTRSEFDLLHEMLRASGGVLSRTDLVRAVRGDNYPKDAYISDSDERAVEVHIGNLRRKLRDDPESPRWLQTVRGAGYRLAARRLPNPPA
ncbi:two-component system OmpR family response regulator [Arthrobacter sp. B2I5]|uniref:response regulator transcription factor n=1 Tax=Arthrobacter sp. B2I5 TaxID=3042266 RepID=UPI00278472A8|nr:response regulator transcription factor [Arthrobacter sp. B2I5]MDQ0826187.1 two-component system OmpR family response regulator [Arthrobacter sp. B2I5]